MELIQKLIDIVYNETGIQGIALAVSRNDDGWTAKVVEDGEILLCAAGETFLVANGHDTMEDAIDALEEKVRQGNALAKEYANQD
jgi:anthranilate phosphoribosyltransferase